MHESHPHWTSDPELVERYVLNRLDSAERSRLAAHLRTCSDCARVVRAEDVLVAGIRAHGRAGMKARLKERVALGGGSGLSWYQLVGAAAAIVVLLTVGIHNRWFMEGGVEQPPVSFELAEEEPLPSQGERDDADKSDKQISPERNKGEAGPRASGSVAMPSPAEQDPVQPQIKDERVSPPLTGPSRPRTAFEDYSLSSKPAPSTVTTLRKDPEVWLEGRIIESPVQSSRTLDLRDHVSVESKLKAQASEFGASKRSGDRAWIMKRGEQEGGLQILQRSLSDLPQTRRASQRMDPENVPALLEQIDSLTQLTLFLDSLLPESDLERAVIEQVTEDSIVIEVGSQRIGYKIPNGVAVPMQLRQKKR
ncbi:MAG: zf-HC2 domain-containing protein [Bacteroidota bacterium]